MHGLRYAFEVIGNHDVDRITERMIHVRLREIYTAKIDTTILDTLMSHSSSGSRVSIVDPPLLDPSPFANLASRLARAFTLIWCSCEDQQ